MGKFAGGALRFLGTLFYVLEFCCAAIVLGIYSYFLAKLSINDLRISTELKAIEGISGAAVIYTILAVLLTFFLGGNKFFGFLAILLNVAFCGAFIAIAVLTDEAADGCDAIVLETPLGTGPRNAEIAGTHLSFACALNQAAFAVAIIAALLFIFSIILQIFVIRNHQKEKKYGPSPANNYTSGSGNRRFWKRKQMGTAPDYTAGNAEMGGTSAYRQSAETGYTGTTATNDTYANGTKYETATGPTYHSGYHTGPTGTSVNPYGYDNTRPTGTAVNY